MFDFIDDDELPSYRVLSCEEREYALSKARFKLEIIRAFEESHERNNRKRKCNGYH